MAFPAAQAAKFAATTMDFLGCEVEAFDDDVGECTETAGGQCSADLDQHVAVHLRIYGQQLWSQMETEMSLTLSSSEKHLARMGESGNQKSTNTPQSTEADPLANSLKNTQEARTIPQRMMLAERYLAMGTRWMIQFVGYSTHRTAM
ncbi:hypothetical protein KCU65_g93, partial [Aureobasidium melanogenum]